MNRVSDRSALTLDVRDLAVELGERANRFLDREVPTARVFALAALVALVVGLLVTRMSVPITHADEYGYLGLARWLAGEGVHTRLNYEPGLPLILTPVVVLAPKMATAYQMALYVNAVMYGATFLVLVLGLAAGRGRDVRWLDAVAAGGVMVFPSFLAWNHVAMTEVPTMFLSAVAFFGFARGTNASCLLAGTVLGMAFAVHFRAVGMITAGLIATLVLLGRHERTRAVATVGGLAVSITLSVLLSRLLVYTEAGSSGSLGSAETGIFTRTVNDPIVLLRPGVGLASYLAVATMGFVVVGVVAAVRHLRNRPDLVYAVLVAVLAIGLAATRTARELQLHQWFYTRHASPLLLPLTAVGAQALLGRSITQKGAAFAALAIALAAGSLVAIRRGLVGDETGFNPFDSPELVTYWIRAGNIGAAALALVGVGLAAAVLLMFAARYPQFSAAVFLVLVMVQAGVSRGLHEEYFVRGSKERAIEQTVGLRLAQLASPSDCAIYDTADPSLWHRYHYRHLFSGHIYEPFSDPDRDLPTCRWLITRSDETPTLTTDATLVVDDSRAEHRLWRVSYLE